MKHIFSIVSTLPADALAPFSVRPYPCTAVTIFGSCIFGTGSWSVNIPDFSVPDYVPIPDL